MKSNEKPERTMLKTLPQKEQAEQNAPEKKDKKRQKKSKKLVTDGPPKNDVRYRGNAKSRADGQKNNQAGKRDVKVPQQSLLLGKTENAWNPARNAAESLFPHVESIVTEVNEEDELERVLRESVETAFLEKCAMDPPQNEAAANSTEEPEPEWGKVQRNLPTPELEKESKISDRNNNSGLPPIENLTVPAVKLQRRTQTLSTGAEIQSRNEASPIETPLVPAIAPKYIDQYGRVDGCTEKRLFMGKGARFKEQEYLKQLQQQKQQLAGPNLLPELPILPSNSSDTYSDLSNALSQVSSKEDDAVDSLASCESHNENMFDAMEEAYRCSKDYTENLLEFNSESKAKVNDSQYPDSEELASQKFVPPTKKFTSLSSGEAPTLSENDYVLSTIHSRIELEAFAKTSEAFSGKNLKQETRDSSLQNSSSQAKHNLYIPEQTSGQKTQNSHIPEPTTSQSRQDPTPAGRPIVSGANSNNYQQKRYQSSGISVNRGGYHDGNGGDRNFNKHRENQYGRGARIEQYSGRGSRIEQYSDRTYGHDSQYDFGAPKDDRKSNNYRNPRYEQNPHKYSEQNRGYHNGSRGDHNSQKWTGAPKRDFQSGPRADQSSQKWEGQQKRDFQKGQNVDRSSQKWDDFPRRSTADQNPHKFDDQNRDLHGGSSGDRSSYKPDGEQKRVNHKPLRADTNPFIPLQESAETAKKNEYHAHSQMEKNPPVSVEALNINASPKEETHAWPADVAINNSQRSFENVPSAKSQNESKDFNDTSSNTSEIPDISNFASRYTEFPPEQDFMREVISVPPVNPPPTNSHSVPPTNSSSVTNPFFLASAPRCPEFSGGVGSKDNMQYSSSPFPVPPGFQSREPPTQSSCVSCTPEMPLEARYANLLLTDPLLFRLLQQKHAANSSPSMKFPTKPENSNALSANSKVHGSCPNCSCNSQSPRNFTQETTTPEVKPCHSKEEERAQFQSWNRSIPPPINAYPRNPVAAQHPETLQRGYVENAQWTASNMRYPNIPHHENLQFVTCLVDPAGNTFPLTHPMGGYPYQHVQQAINVQPRGEEFPAFLPPDYENQSPEVQRLMLQKLYAHQYENASGYPMQSIIGRNVQQGAQMPMPFPFPPFPPHKYDVDIAAMSRSNVVQGNLCGYHEAEHHQPLAPMGGDLNNQEETGKVLTSGRGAGEKPNIQPVAIEGRRRVKTSQNN